MTKSMADMPVIHITDGDLRSGELMPLIARFAVENGPIFKRTVTQGPYAGQEFVYMVGPEANRFVMHTHRHHFSHDLGWTPILGESMGKGLLNMDDPEHARHRKMWNPAFTAACMEAYLPLMQQVIAARTSSWVEQGDVDVFQEAREITFDVAATALAGFPTGLEVDHLRSLFYTILHGFNPSEETWEDYERRSQAARLELITMLFQLIAARRSMPEGEQPRDVLGTIVNARDENGQPLDDIQVMAHLNILLLAGHETTTTLGAYTLYLLAALPEQRQRVQDELDALLGHTNGALPVEAVRNMKVLDNFIKEAGRLYPPVIIVPRGTAKDFEFGGYTVPAGQLIRLCLGASHRLPTVFANPNRFDPDRFAPPREEDRRQQYSLVTFGGGPRVCIGLNFANIEVKALVAHVLRHFHLEPVPGQNLAHSGFITAELPNGIWVRVKPPKR